MKSWGKKKANPIPNYNPSKEENDAYFYCVNEDIRISPIAIDGKIGEWYIGISTPENYKKVYNSKFIYDKNTVWSGFYEMCKYYYDKH